MDALNMRAAVRSPQNAGLEGFHGRMPNSNLVLRNLASSRVEVCPVLINYTTYVDLRHVRLCRMGLPSSNAITRVNPAAARQLDPFLGTVGEVAICQVAI